MGDVITQEFSLQTSYFGVEESFDEDGFSLVPNPNTGVFTLYFGTLQEQVEVTVYDMQGRQLACRLGRAVDELHWNLEGLPSGMYFVKVVADGKCLARKMMINR